MGCGLSRYRRRFVKQRIRNSNDGIWIGGHRQTPPYQRRGVTLLSSLVMMPILMGFAALAVNVGYLGVLRTETQTNADAGALASATAIYDNQFDVYESRALTIIEPNQNGQGFLSLADQVVEIGRWDKAAKTFTTVAPADVGSSNAVRVVGNRTGAALYFANLVGVSDTSVAREAIAFVSPACGGVWGINSVTIPGNVTIDSYDSTDGAYSAGAATSNGDACSGGSVTVSGSADIDGDVMGSSVTLLGGALTISGETEISTDTVDPPTVDFGDVATYNDNAMIGLTSNGTDPLSVDNDLTLVSDDVLILVPGRYYFRNFTMTAGSILSLTGATEIYLTGSLEATGSSLINTTLDPADLTIYSTGPLVKLAGNAEFYGSILAPDATLQLTGTSDFYGAVVGGTVDMTGNFTFHVDESLSLVAILKGTPILVK